MSAELKYKIGTVYIDVFILLNAVVVILCFYFRP